MTIIKTTTILDFIAIGLPAEMESGNAMIQLLAGYRTWISHLPILMYFYS